MADNKTYKVLRLLNLDKCNDYLTASVKNKTTKTLDQELDSIIIDYLYLEKVI